MMNNKVSPAHLYLPANNVKMVRKASSLAVGTVILDLEDSIPADKKAQALSGLPEILALLPGHQVWVRINQGSGGLRDAQALVAMSGITGVWIPKAEPSQSFEDLMTFVSEETALSVGVLIESAFGYEQRDTLVRHPGVSQVQLGEYDFRADVGIASLDATTFHHLDSIRLGIVVSARAAGLDQIVGPVSADYRNLDHFSKTTQMLFEVGHTSRACIHPNQVAIVNELGIPSNEKIAWARKIINQFEQEAKNGHGAYSDEAGNMADAATVRQARKIICAGGLA